MMNEDRVRDRAVRETRRKLEVTVVEQKKICGNVQATLAIGDTSSPRKTQPNNYMDVIKASAKLKLPSDIPFALTTSI